LPLRDGALDLVFLQNTLLWVRQVAAAVREAARVLEPGGCLVALEPDFGGMLEHPPEVGLQDVWVRALTAAGADPFIGRKLPSLCEKVGLAVWFELQGVPSPADATDLDLLAPLPLTLEERSRLAAVQGRIASRAGRWDVLVHLPYTLLVATKPLA
jgi:SAM-dependent methyltransferase